ncbi:MAG: hypothetical protein HQM08_17500 [Candidatus Riflebacteria bacterium]|nr:hypothetical protein [Candidatus Riflebacteria bacterium]
MPISDISSLLSNAFNRLDKAATQVESDPVNAMVSSSVAQNQAQAGSNLIKAKDEMLGSVLDIKA